MWEPGPREAGSWYDWTLRVGKRTANLSLAIGLRGCGGAITIMINGARKFPQSIQTFSKSGQPTKVILKNVASFFACGPRRFVCYSTSVLDDSGTSGH